MIDVKAVQAYFKKLAGVMEEQSDYLIKLDSVTGDSDLGLSMKFGFAAVTETAGTSDAADLGKLIQKSAMALNEAAPSTLGTILSIGLMAGGKAWKGKTQCGTAELAEFMSAANGAIMAKSGSAPGEKTILDALVPAQKALEDAAAKSLPLEEALNAAAMAAAKGCEDTIQMKGVHGRAAFYAEKTIGLQDGGATVAKIIFETMAEHAN